MLVLYGNETESDESMFGIRCFFLGVSLPGIITQQFNYSVCNSGLMRTILVIIWKFQSI